MSPYSGPVLVISSSLRTDVHDIDVFSWTGDAIRITGSGLIAIENAVITSIPGRAMELIWSYNIKIINVTVDADSILMDNCTGALLQKIEIIDGPFRYSVTTCSDCTFLDNVLRIYDGWQFADCIDCSLRNNTLYGDAYITGENRAFYLISLLNCAGLKVADNMFIDQSSPSPFMSMAYDDEPGNEWNDDEVGNDWSNWNGTGPYPIAGAGGAFDLKPRNSQN
ncbi:MAG TPA: hypothetical protein VLH13_03335 [Methanomassiliicoccales archaeon]|nr:hypothetical protein [Methanomassiliicoccales archaeon]